jgi:hypothetical protein
MPPDRSEVPGHDWGIGPLIPPGRPAPRTSVHAAERSSFGVTLSSSRGLRGGQCGPVGPGVGSGSGFESLAAHLPPHVADRVTVRVGGDCVGGVPQRLGTRSRCPHPRPTATKPPGAAGHGTGRRKPCFGDQSPTPGLTKLGRRPVPFTSSVPIGTVLLEQRCSGCTRSACRARERPRRPSCSYGHAGSGRCSSPALTGSAEAAAARAAFWGRIQRQRPSERLQGGDGQRTEHLRVLDLHPLRVRAVDIRARAVPVSAFTYFTVVVDYVSWTSRCSPSCPHQSASSRSGGVCPPRSRNNRRLLREIPADIGVFRRL